MIDAQAIDFSVGDESEHKTMARLEDSFILDTNTRKIVGVEKPPVVDVIGRDSPIGQAEGLRLDEFVKIVKAGRVGGIAVNTLDAGVNASKDFWSTRAQFFETALMNLFVAAALVDAILTILGSEGQVMESCDQTLKLKKLRILLAQRRS